MLFSKEVEKMKYKKSYRKKKINKKKRLQKGGAFGAGMALGMFLPQVLGAASNILKINV